MGTTRKVIVIGSGPAGYTAAIYAARANLAPLMLTGVQPGGQLMLTTLVENYPGFVEGIQGPELMETMKRQAEHFGTEMIAEDVTAVDFSRRPFVVQAGDATWEGHTIIIATGATAKLLGLPAETKLMGRGISTCATCDGFFFKDQNIMVVGGGDSAMEEALYLSRLGKKVDVVHRRDTLRASKIMQERAFKNPKIEFVWDSAVDDVMDVEKGKVTAVRLRNLKTGTALGPSGRRRLHSDRPRAEHPDLPRPDRAPAERLHQGEARDDRDERAGRLRGGRRPGPRLPPGGDGRGDGLHGCARGRAVP